MNALQLHLPDGTPAWAFQCQSCKTIYAEKEPYSSERCCKCRDCGVKIERNGWRCDPCRIASDAKSSMEKMERAVEIVGYDGPVVADIDDYFGSVSDLVDRRDDTDELPEFVHTCHVRPYSLDAGDILQNIIENAGVEDHDESNLNGVDEFMAAVEAFNAANRENVYWEEDSKHKVRVPKPDKTEGAA